jgi:hypothetical protein
MKIHVGKVLLSLILTSMLFLGCSSSPDSQKSDAAQAAKPKSVAAAVQYMEAHIGDAVLRGRQLKGYEFDFSYMQAMAGLTKWNGMLVFGVDRDEGNGRNTILKALTVDLAADGTSKPALEPAVKEFHDGVLAPPAEAREVYSDPAGGAGAYLYFSSRSGISSISHDGPGAALGKYGAKRLAIDPDGQSAYIFSNKIMAQGTLANGTFTPTRTFSTNGTSLVFSSLEDVAVGPDHRLYAAGKMKSDQSNVLHKIAIYTPDMNQVTMFGTDVPDYAPPRGRAFPRLAVTSKYIFSWKQADIFTLPAQLCLWTHDGAYLGQVVADKVFGEGWQPLEVTNWDENTLVIAAAKITNMKETKNPETGRTNTERTWTYGFFLLQLE